VIDYKVQNLQILSPLKDRIMDQRKESRLPRRLLLLIRETTLTRPDWVAATTLDLTQESPQRIARTAGTNTTAPRDSFQTVAPPALRQVVTTGDIPGATAIYPSDPFQQRNTIVYNNFDDFRSFSLVSADAAPIIQARLVRDSEILPRHRHKYSGDIMSDLEDVESSRPGTTTNSKTITEAVKVIQEDEVSGRPKTLWTVLGDRRVIAVLTCLASVVIGLVVGLTVIGMHAQDDLDGNTEFGDETFFMGPSIISENEDIATSILGNLPLLSNGALLVPGSPQRVALNWLVNNNILREMQSFQIIQRFALADLYFSTGGLSVWVNRTGWLSRDNECTWFQSDYFAESNQQPIEPCNSEGRMHSLVLDRNGLVGSLPDGLALFTDLGMYCLCFST
jgi:hypothetical protein